MRTLLFGAFVAIMICCATAEIIIESYECKQTFATNCDERSILRYGTAQFITELIHRKLPHCYVIQVRDYDPELPQTITKLPPTIAVDVRKPSSARIFTELNTFQKRFSIRFQYQCIVYWLLLKDPQITENRTASSRLASVFQTPALQIQAQSSYVFVSYHDDVNPTSDTLLLSPILSNFEHKVLIQIQPTARDAGKDSRNLRGNGVVFRVHSFCYFCNEGNAGISEDYRTFTTVFSVKNIGQIFPSVTTNLNGKPLKVTAAMALPFVGILASPKDPTSLRIEGMQAVILKAIAKAINFSIVLENTSKGLTGSRLANGTWTGTIGEVLYGRSDIGLNAAPSTDRYPVVDFTVSAFYGFLVLVSTKPSPFFEWKAIVYPFEPSAWLGICLSTAITVLLYRLFLRHGQKTLRRGKKSEELRRSKNKPSYVRVCYVTIGSLLEQGQPFNYDTSPARVYALFWFMFVTVGTCAYKSKLFSYLTFPIISIPPSSFYELSVSDYHWGLKSLGGVAFLFITKSPVSYVRSIGERMEILMDKYSCIDRTFSEKFVCIVYRAYYDYMSAVRYWKISHKFHVSDYVTPPVGSSWVLPKYSPLLGTLNKFTYNQFEMGLSGIYLEHYIKEMALRSRALAQASTDAKDLFEPNTKFKRQTQLEKPLEFVNVYASFLILLFGLVIALGIFFAEILRYRSRIKRAEMAARRIRVLRIALRFSYLRQKRLRLANKVVTRLRNSARLLCGNQDTAIESSNTSKF